MNQTKMGSLTWQQHWEQAHTPWDAGQSAPALLHLLQAPTSIAAALVTSTSQSKPRALVPGCGTGYDVFALAEAGFTALGLDLAPALEPHFQRAREKANISAEAATLKVGSFFDLPEQESGGFDFAWDYTFLCALDPKMRQDWASTYSLLIRTGGILATLIFPIGDPESSSGNAPHPINFTLVQSLLGEQFELVERSLPEASHPGREGKEELALWRKL